jgi:hypothetical protein
LVWSVQEAGGLRAGTLAAGWERGGCWSSKVKQSLASGLGISKFLKPVSNSKTFLGLRTSRLRAEELPSKEQESSFAVGAQLQLSENNEAGCGLSERRPAAGRTMRREIALAINIWVANVSSFFRFTVFKFTLEEAASPDQIYG